MGRLIRTDLNGCGQAIPAAIDRLDEPFCTSAIAQELSDCPECTLQRCVADEVVGPDPLAQLLLCDHTVVMLEEVGEHVPRFRSESYELTSPVQHMEAGVQFTVTKSVDHLAPFLRTARRSREGWHTDACLVVISGGDRRLAPLWLQSSGSPAQQ